MTFSPFSSLRRRARLFARSSAVVAALFSLVLGTTAFAADAATASISPFINKDTLVVARVNFDNIDVARFAETLDGIVATALKDVGYDAASVEKVGAELDKTFAAFAEDGKTALAEARKTTLPGEAFFVLQSTKGEGAALLIPVETLSDAQRDQLTTTVKLAVASRGFDAAVYQKRWLVVASDLKAFGRYYKTFKSGDNRKIDAFFKQNSAAFVAGYCGKLRIRPFLDKATGGMTQEMLFAQTRSVRDALEIFDTMFVDAGWTFDAGTCVARASFRFNAPVDAGRLLASLQAIVDEAAKTRFESDQALLNGLIPKASVKEFKLTPLARELWRGQMRSQLPKQNGAELVFERDLTKAAAKASGNAALYAVGLAALGQVVKKNALDVDATDGEVDFEFDEEETPADGTKAGNEAAE
ncbi:MAG: hypothetical protein IKY61_00930 [Thermoguttaceae bacterium]|nr:hypothetical protein [Thermoguttaceae bacterium]